MKIVLLVICLCMTSAVAEYNLAMKKTVFLDSDPGFKQVLSEIGPYMDSQSSWERHEEVIMQQHRITGFFADAKDVDPEIINLWNEGPPDAKGTDEADKAFIMAYLPEEELATGAGIVVCPGGGYGHLAMGHEGEDVAAWLNSIGVAAFVLKYRHSPEYQHPTPLRDAQRAIRLVRAHAEEWGVEEGKLGILGFSAGGHLAASTGIHFNWEDKLASDAIDKLSARPDFMVLAYPVISMTEDYMHRGSRNNLLGKDASEEMAAMMSHERQVTADTPPAFLFHTTTDTAVPPENSIYLYLALKEAGVDVEMHIYEEGRHGVGLAPDDPALNTWPAMVESWLKKREVI